MDIGSYMKEKALKARKASRVLANLSTKVKNDALLSMADGIERKALEIIKENRKDIEAAKNKGMSKAMIDRLALNFKVINEMAIGLREVTQLPDPVGEIMKIWKRPNGMEVGKMRVPIGVIGIIYEARPNVTADASSLCIKAGNAVILRGGSEAINSNKAIVSVLSESAEKAGVPGDAITFMDNPDRQAVTEMLKLEALIDLIIPRGGEGLIRAVVENSKVPVIKHYKGVCHVYVDNDADLRMAEDICFNAKVQRPGTCNAMETMLVHKDIAKKFLSKMVKRLQNAGVELKGCKETLKLITGLKKASDRDWYREYLDLILNIKIVTDMDDAMDHIATYGSQHSDSIVTNNHQNAMRFLREVDSSAVLINASTRLNDGFQFGLGAEIGISTTRIHARGPMGLEELTCPKFIVFGNGQLRE